MTRRLPLVLPCLLALFGCAVELPPAEADPDLGKADGDGVSAATLEHTAAGVGILRLLNDPGTDLALLDEHLDRRAAENLIAHRDGGDGVYRDGAGDDDPFETVAEVDDVYWVGYRALRTLRDLAFTLDFVPGPDGLLGEYDGVPFTVSEAERALRTANFASEEELRDIGLNATMIASVVEARPIANLGVLAELYFIGPATLERLRDHGAEGPGGEACASTDDCPAGLRCAGVPVRGNPPLLGRCHDVRRREGEDESCRADADCAAGLFCSGLTMYEQGHCRALWMRTTYTTDAGGSIPSVAMPEPTAYEFPIVGLASVPEDILVEADIDFTEPRALRITLLDPNGQVGLLWDGPNEPSGAVFDPSWTEIWGISRDDMVNGTWALTVQNVTGGGEGALRGFSVTVSSRYD